MNNELKTESNNLQNFSGTLSKKVISQNKKNKEKYPDIYDELPECKICGMKSRNLAGVHLKTHCMNSKEYMEKFNLTKSDITHESYTKEMSERVSGDKNPAYQHGGKFSPYSKKFVKYQNLSDDEKETKIKELAGDVVTTRDNNNNDTTKLSYYTSRGYSLEESKKLLSERQRTFSLDICINKHGKNEGTKKWEERQEKWLDTLDNKTEEEKVRINKLKSITIDTFINKYGREEGEKRFLYYRINRQQPINYSKISQELFFSIIRDERIKNKFDKSDMFFAEHNGEFKVITNKSYKFLDFFIYN